MTPKLKKIIVLILIAILMFIVYVLFVKPDPQQDVFIGGRNTTQGNAKLLGAQISQSLLRIEQIKLEKDIFNNPLYTSLVDRSRVIPLENIGRPNPFAPIGAISSAPVQNTTSTQTEEPAQQSNAN